VDPAGASGVALVTALAGGVGEGSGGGVTKAGGESLGGGGGPLSPRVGAHAQSTVRIGKNRAFARPVFLMSLQDDHRQDRSGVRLFCRWDEDRENRGLMAT
jgi:hypothetical protein